MLDIYIHLQESVHSPGRITSLSNSEGWKAPYFIETPNKRWQAELEVLKSGHHGAGWEASSVCFGVGTANLFWCVCYPPDTHTHTHTHTHTLVYPSTALLCSWPSLIFLFTPLSVSQSNRSNVQLSCGFVYSGSDPRPARDAQALQLFFHIWHFFPFHLDHSPLPPSRPPLPHSYFWWLPPALFNPKKFCSACSPTVSVSKCNRWPPFLLLLLSCTCRAFIRSRAPHLSSHLRGVF